MDTLDGRKSSRAIGTLLVLGVLSSLAVASYAQYESQCNTDETTIESAQPMLLASPFLRVAPCADEPAPDAEAEAEAEFDSPDSDQPTGIPATRILSI
jgi:hypothetical protein